MDPAGDAGLRPTAFGSSCIAAGLSRDDGLCYRVIAACPKQDRRVHHLVTEDAGGGHGEIAVTEQRNRAKIGADDALLEADSEAQHGGLTECG